jgi:multicomponent Na+:H+ antiporter subunit F
VTGFLLGAALWVLATIALGLLELLRGPGDAERMMAAQLIGSGGVAVLLLLAAVTGDGAVVDIALTLALLSAFASIAFAREAPGSPPDDSGVDR